MNTKLKIAGTVLGAAFLCGAIVAASADSPPDYNTGPVWIADAATPPVQLVAQNVPITPPAPPVAKPPVITVPPVAAAAPPPMAPVTPATFTGTSGKDLSIEINRGALVRLQVPADTVFVANPEIADIQVKSPRLIYVFAKRAGETVLYAVDAND